MRYIRGFRDGAPAAAMARLLAAEVDARREYHLMEFCGGHTHAIFRYGVEDLLPANIHLVHGPGCPVCVLAVPRLDGAIELAHQPGVTLVSYGDMLRVPASRRRSLLKARAQGADVRMVYSALEALEIAAAHPDRQVVFFAIGFETTTPATAHIILEAQRRGLGNFSVYCNHVLTPAAIQSILDSPEVREWGQVRVDGFIGPSHVSAVIGSRPYEFFAEEYQRPVVIAGFEPLDVLQAIRMLVQQLNARPCLRRERIYARGYPRGQCQGATAGGGGLRAATELRMARLGRAALQRSAHQVRLRRRSMPSDASRSRRGRCPRTRPASARRSSAGSRSLPTARSLQRCARRTIRSARAWCPPKALAPPTISTVATRCRLPADAHPAVDAQLQQPVAAALRRACPRRSRALGGARHSRARHARGRRSVPAAGDSRAVSQARDPRVGVAATSMSGGASRATGRPRSRRARLGDPARRSHLGSHGAAGRLRSWMPVRSGPARPFRCASHARAACIATK